MHLVCMHTKPSIVTRRESYTSAQVGINAHVAGSSAKRLALAVRYMLFSLGVAVLFGHAKVDDMNHVGVFAVWLADQKVVGLDVAVDQVLFMDRLDTRQLLLSESGQKMWLCW